MLAACSQQSEKNTPVAESRRYTDIVIIMADDMGYSDLGCYGSEIHTPHLDSLAASGLRSTRFYNNAKCYPSRASLLTGMYPHKTGLGRHILHLNKPKEATGPFQGWLSEGTITIAEALKTRPYKSYMSGKWHVGENPEDWPLKRGFDGYFGLISGASSYYEIIGGQKRVRQMVLENELWTPPDSGFYLTDAISDYAAKRIETAPLDSGLFIYVAYTAPHWPLHALEEDIQKYEGIYDVGWDTIRQRRLDKMKALNLVKSPSQLSPKPGSIPNWESVGNKQEWARKMAVYAAMIDRMDQGVGRIVKALKKRGNFENTLIIFLSDNGASSENIAGRKLHNPKATIGSRGSYLSYEEPWANVSNAPFLRYKLELEEGGIATPLIASWPKLIEPRYINDHYIGHISDFFPTIMDITATDLSQDYVTEIDGKSMMPLFTGAASFGHDTLFWEYQNRKAIMARNWKLIQGKSGAWKLYDLSTDRIEQQDLSLVYPDKVDSLAKSYQQWTEKIGI